MSEETTHDQEWRDSQPVAEPESTAEKFRAALKRAQKRADQEIAIFRVHRRLTPKGSNPFGLRNAFGDLRSLRRSDCGTPCAVT